MKRIAKLLFFTAAVMLILSMAACSYGRKEGGAADASGALHSGSEDIPVHKHDPADKPVYDPDASCSIYIYMCGSNLESKRGLAGKDIDELLAADIPEQVNVVLETGGAAKWHSHGIANDKLQRYIIKDHALQLVDELENQSMGNVNTFMDFLSWGRAAYPAERNLLVIWDHGGNATEGVCYDENYGFNGLKQSDFRFLQDQEGAAEIFADGRMDMVIFDTCLMGNIETASWIQDYYHYMIASEVIIPGNGLDYRVIAGEFASHDNESFGRLVCDSFMELSWAKEQEDTAQIALFDLAKTDGLLNALEKLYADQIHRLQKSDATDKEGGSGDAFFYVNAAEQDMTIAHGKDYNVVDIYNYTESINRDNAGARDAVQEALQEMVLYQAGNVPAESFPDTKTEDYRNLCNGISMYYPLTFDRAKLADYIRICPIEKYAEFLDLLYMHVPEVSLAFVNRGSRNGDGLVEIQLTKESADYLKEIRGNVWKQSASDGSYIMIGSQTVNIFDIADMKFTVPFTGEWYYLGGQRLYAAVEQHGSIRQLSAPILWNGEYTEYFTSYFYSISGKPVFRKGTVGQQFDENGLIQRILNYHPLRTGDVVRVVSEDDTEEIPPFTVESDNITVEAKMLEPGTYRVQLIAVDINNHAIHSDYALYQVTEDGASVLGIEKYDE